MLGQLYLADGVLLLLHFALLRMVICFVISVSVVTSLFFFSAMLLVVGPSGELLGRSEQIFGQALTAPSDLQLFTDSMGVTAIECLSVFKVMLRTGSVSGCLRRIRSRLPCFKKPPAEVSEPNLALSQRLGVTYRISWLLWIHGHLKQKSRCLFFGCTAQILSDFVLPSRAKAEIGPEICAAPTLFVGGEAISMKPLNFVTFRV